MEYCINLLQEILDLLKKYISSKIKYTKIFRSYVIMHIYGILLNKENQISSSMIYDLTKESFHLLLIRKTFIFSNTINVLIYYSSKENRSAFGRAQNVIASLNV